MHVVVVGAGIAGMTAAIALCQKGVEVTVLEHAPALKEIGAGIQLAANGSLVGVRRCCRAEMRRSPVIRDARYQRWQVALYVALG